MTPCNCSGLGPCQGPNEGQYCRVARQTEASGRETGVSIGLVNDPITPTSVMPKNVDGVIGANAPFDMKETNYGLGAGHAVRQARQRQEILDLLEGMAGALYTEDRTRCVSIEALRDVLTDWRFGIEGSIHYPMDEDGYHALANVLHRAYKDAALGGKGHARHGTDKVAFEDQDSIGHVAPLFGVGYLLGQATKKARESMRLSHEPAVRELLGAIVYIAGAIVHLEKKHSDIPF